MNQLEIGELVIIQIHAEAKVQASIPPVNELVGPVVEKVGESGISRHQGSMHLRLDLGPLSCCEGDVPSREPSLALAVLAEDEPNHEC